ncbi:MAG: hypothetical protein WAR24_04870 [Candidatus Acidiferrales bacterium]
MNPYFYLPFVQHYATNSLETLQVRTAAAPAAMIPEIERVLETLAPELPVFDVKTMTEALDTLNGCSFIRWARCSPLCSESSDWCSRLSASTE